MTAVATDKPEGQAQETGEQDGEQGKGRFGRVLDVAGICAGVVLGVILFDVLSGGKITRWAQKQRGRGQPPDDSAGGGEPCEDC